MKNVVVVTSSPRKGGNSDTLAMSFAEGAKAAGHNVKIIALRDLNLKFCMGCLFCQVHDRCVLSDEMNGLYPDFEEADVLVFATPVYYYSISGQLKTFLDRLNPLYSKKVKFRDVYLLASSADNEEKSMDVSVSVIQGWVDCFEGVKIAGVLRGTGVGAKGEIEKTEFPAVAYTMGENIENEDNQE